MRHFVLIGTLVLFCGMQYSAAQNQYICNRKENGTYFDSNDGCSLCVCINGALSCQSKPCPALYCPVEHHENIKGECCPSCKSGCHSEELGYIEPGASKATENECFECFCSEDSEMECVAASCLACTGHWTDDGTCCGRCDMNQCNVDGKVYKDGEEVESDDACATCHCVADGEHVEVICEMMMCYQCLGEWTDDGSCCGRCDPPVCKHKRKTYQIGDEIPTKDKCSECFCAQVQSGAEVMCVMMACEPCPGRTINDGSCCGRCEPTCMVRGEVYDIGIEVPGNSPCETCMCEMSESGNPEVVCMTMACAILCPNGQELIMDDESCCGHCEDIMIPLPDCDAIRCEEPKCSPKMQYTPIGECCAQCQCKYKRQTINPGPFMDKCKSCICENGTVSCTSPACPKKALECVDAELGEDCCYHCPNGKTCAHPKVKGKVIKYGEYEKVKSEYCTCAGDPWFPVAFCTKSKVPKSLLKKFGNQVADRMTL